MINFIGQKFAPLSDGGCLNPTDHPVVTILELNKETDEMSAFAVVSADNSAKTCNVLLSLLNSDDYFQMVASQQQIDLINHWLAQKLGSFSQNLMNALNAADFKNRQILSTGFPMQANALFLFGKGLIPDNTGVLKSTKTQNGGYTGAGDA